VWLYDIPVWLALPAFMAGFVLLSWAVVLVLRRWVLRVSEGNAEWDRVLGYAMATYGIFYGITIGLIAVSVYENFMHVDEIVLHETSSLAVLYRDASGFPSPTSEELQELIRSYTRFVISDDWPLQQQGIVPGETVDDVTRIQNVIFSFQPSSPAEISLQSHTIEQFNEFVEARRARIGETELALPGLLWLVLAVGALMNAVLVGLIEVRNLRVHLIMSGIIAAFVALLIYAILSLDHPYAGAVNVSSEEFRILLEGLLAPGGG
jgi:uncharacterized membrane protein YraQ (UPF0718 family)